MKINVFCVLLSMAILLAGCAGTGKQNTGGPSQEKYLFGTYSAVFPCSLRIMDKAVRTVCQKARLYEVSRNNNMNACFYQYKDINQTRLYIELQENKDQSTKIKIRVATTGDKESSQSILLEIERQLRAQGAI